MARGWQQRGSSVGWCRCVRVISEDELLEGVRQRSAGSFLPPRSLWQLLAFVLMVRSVRQNRAGRRVATAQV
ncbi:hypothetical protein chiPu_0011062 [Chiloscyllium punctatum]|uniref:Uncharacterized protein n=1 Tax=Chiloscyllium punctatum TaxID=137246 RepID=A0A401SQB8_CHIPU|nr:hypothetical protein [Chiloscyllium punctatum]